MFVRPSGSSVWCCDILQKIIRWCSRRVERWWEKTVCSANMGFLQPLCAICKPSWEMLRWVEVILTLVLFVDLIGFNAINYKSFTVVLRECVFFVQLLFVPIFINTVLCRNELVRPNASNVCNSILSKPHFNYRTMCRGWRALAKKLLLCCCPISTQLINCMEN